MRLASLFTVLLLASASLLVAGEPEEGFVSLFDGKTLNGWQGSLKGYVAEDGVLVCLKSGGGKLFTTKEYGDFIFRLSSSWSRTPTTGWAFVRVGLRPGLLRHGDQILDDSGALRS